MIAIQKATKNDIEAIVRVHEAAFPDFFLTQLGTAFLRLYYKSVMNHMDGVLLTCKMDGATIGLCAGTVLSAGFNKKIIKANLFQFGIETLKLLFSKPKSLIHLMKNMSKEDSSVGDNGEYAELLSIAVDPTVQRSGAGKTMLLDLENEIREKGGKKLSLTTDFENNEKAIGFYKSLGYNEWYDFTTYPNRRMWRLIKNL
jgi:ribosomal protein S18 acetylase RimI-like enzyme